MVIVAQLVRVPDCDSGGRGFKSRLSPQFLYHGGGDGLSRLPAKQEDASSSLVRGSSLEEEDMIKGTRIITGAEAKLMTASIDAMRGCLHRLWL